MPDKVDVEMLSVECPGTKLGNDWIRTDLYDPCLMTEAAHTLRAASPCLAVVDDAGRDHVTQGRLLLCMAQS